MKRHILSQKTKNRTHLVAFILLLFSIGIIALLFPKTITITGMVTVLDVAPQGFEFQDPGNISKEMVELEFNVVKQKISSMKEKELPTAFVDDVFNEANQMFKKRDLLETMERLQLINFLYEKKIEFIDRMELLKIEEEALADKGVNVESAHQIVIEAEASFYKDQLDPAFNLLEQYDTELETLRIEDSRVRGLAKLSKNFLQRYWWQIVIIIIFLVVISRPIIRKYRQKRSTTELKHLKLEQIKINDLIKGLQTACFADRKISTNTYHNKVRRYEERLLEIKRTIPVLENIAQGNKTNNEKNNDQNVIKKKAKGVIEVKK